MHKDLYHDQLECNFLHICNHIVHHYVRHMNRFFSGKHAYSPGDQLSFYNATWAALSTIVEVVWLMRVDNGRWFNALLSSDIKAVNHEQLCLKC